MTNFSNVHVIVPFYNNLVVKFLFMILAD